MIFFLNEELREVNPSIFEITKTIKNYRILLEKLTEFFKKLIF